MTEGLGDWDAISVDTATGLFSGAGFRWWISGGYALELHMDRGWRSHGDIDVGVLRSQTPLVRDRLADWDLWTAASARLSPWDGRPLSGERHENNIWARRSPEQAWAIDLTLNEGTSDRWVYRRDQGISLPWSRAVLRTRMGVPYLAPEVQLLFKSKHPRPKDDVDAEQVVPELTVRHREFLRQHLSPKHRWRDLLGPS